MPERTFFMLKPDAVERGLRREIFKRVRSAGFTVVEEAQIEMLPEPAKDLYSIHRGKPFYDGLIQFIASGPVVVSILEKNNAVLDLRKLMGATDPRQAEDGTIRGDLKEENIFSPMGTMKNLVHGSDSIESANREIPIFFKA